MARYPEVRMPERPRGTPEEQIRTLYRYAWELAETINNIIGLLNREEDEDDAGMEKTG